ncbi:MAG: hypothetical protein R2695_15645 [Acidimicrobiales bacterium]
MKPTVSLTVLELAAADGAVRPSRRPSRRCCLRSGINGKDANTVSQVLLHAEAGSTRPWRFPSSATAGRLERYARWRTIREPGTARVPRLVGALCSLTASPASRVAITRMSSPNG